MTGWSYPAPVVAVTPEDGDDMAELIEDAMARRDDAFWHAYVRRAFTWRMFTNWWLARRWVVPRDVRRR